MPQVSRNPLKPHIKKEIIHSLWWVLAHLKTEEEIDAFLGDLLTRSEKTMLAKRLAIAILLVKGYSYADIKDILKVSTSTVVGIRRWLDSGGMGYKMAIEKLLKHEKLNQFLKEVSISVARYVARNIRLS